MSFVAMKPKLFIESKQRKLQTCSGSHLKGRLEQQRQS